MQQIKKQQIIDKSNHKSNTDNSAYFNGTNERDLKRMKQRQYREQLLAQQKLRQTHISKNDKERMMDDSGYFFGENDTEMKRLKQEKYRNELLAQMRAQQIKNSKNSDLSPYKLFGNNDSEKCENDYGKQLQLQMRLKKMSKLAEKEKELLEERERLMKGGFLDGFGNNKMPQIHTTYSPQMPSVEFNNNKYRNVPQRYESGLTGLAIGNDCGNKQRVLDKKALYKMELDKQCREAQQKKRRQKLMNDEREWRLEAKVKFDREALIKEKVREDFNLQMRDLSEKPKNINKKLFENEPQSLNTDNNKSMGIFGTDVEKQKLEKARKQEQYQRELKEQALEAKRKKREKELEEKEKDRRLELKIQKELQDLENKYRCEKELEAVNMSNMSLANVVPNIPNPNKQKIINKSQINLQNNNTIPSLAMPQNITHNASRIMHDMTFHKNGAMSVRSPIAPVMESEKINTINRPSTSKQMFKELLSLKQDLLENQKMIREELQLHKQQINEQIRTENDKLDQSKSKTFELEMNKITSEIQDLKKVFLTQNQHKNKVTIPTQSHNIEILDNNHKNSDEISLKNIIDKSSQFIPCSVPQTPISPEILTSFTATEECDSEDNCNQRIDSAFTAFGVDEYLLNESQKNNEYLQFVSRNNSRLHTPNIYRVESLERDFRNTLDMNGANIVERSIKSKSDFLYNMQRSQNENMHKHRDINDNQCKGEQQQCNDNLVNTLLLKNKNRLNYFRATTPLDSTRSMKIGLQKIEDLLSETEKVNNIMMTEHEMCIDNSLYELI